MVLACWRESRRVRGDGQRGSTELDVQGYQGWGSRGCLGVERYGRIAVGGCEDRDIRTVAAGARLRKLARCRRWGVGGRTGQLATRAAEGIKRLQRGVAVGRYAEYSGQPGHAHKQHGYQQKAEALLRGGCRRVIRPVQLSQSTMAVQPHVCREPLPHRVRVSGSRCPRTGDDAWPEAGACAARGFWTRKCLGCEHLWPGGRL